MVPRHDDALKSIRPFAATIAAACLEGTHMAKDMSRQAYRKSSPAAAEAPPVDAADPPPAIGVTGAGA